MNVFALQFFWQESFRQRVEEMLTLFLPAFVPPKDANRNTIYSY